MIVYLQLILSCLIFCSAIAMQNKNTEEYHRSLSLNFYSYQQSVSQEEEKWISDNLMPLQVTQADKKDIIASPFYNNETLNNNNLKLENEILKKAYQNLEQINFFLSLKYAELYQKWEKEKTDNNNLKFENGILKDDSQMLKESYSFLFLDHNKKYNEQLRTKFLTSKRNTTHLNKKLFWLNIPRKKT